MYSPYSLLQLSLSPSLLYLYNGHGHFAPVLGTAGLGRHACIAYVPMGWNRHGHETWDRQTRTCGQAVGSAFVALCLALLW